MWFRIQQLCTALPYIPTPQHAWAHHMLVRWQDNGSGSEWEASDSDASESEAESESDAESEEEEEDLKGKGKGKAKAKKGGEDGARDKRRVCMV